MRNHPLYHLIKARVQRKMGHPEESVNTMHAAMNLPGVKKAGTVVHLTLKNNIVTTWLFFKYSSKSVWVLSNGMSIIPLGIILLLTLALHKSTLYWVANVCCLKEVKYAANYYINHEFQYYWLTQQLRSCPKINSKILHKQTVSWKKR